MRQGTATKTGNPAKEDEREHGHATGRAVRCFLLLCLCAALAPLALALRPVPADTPPVTDTFPGWPGQFEGRPLTPLPLSALEQQFQKDFPGKLGRFTDGKREIILRWVNQGSRRLHAAADCFRANGYTLEPQPMARNGNERWSRFLATHGASRLMVAERITDSQGQQWSDVSAWYWATQMGQTTGPWWAVTVASGMPAEK